MPDPTGGQVCGRWDVDRSYPSHWKTDGVNMSIGPLPDLYKWIVISGTFVVTRFVVV
ncbi:hypothetical protein Tco_0621451, partial [Tanacetum coccineum]